MVFGARPSPQTPSPSRGFMSGQLCERVPAPLRYPATIGRRSTVESVFRPSGEGPRGSAGPGPYHHVPSRRYWRSGLVEQPTGLLPCSTPWRETGPGCMRPRSRAWEERVRRTWVLGLCSGISVQRDAAVWYSRGMGRRRRLGAAPPPRRRAACPAQRRGGQAPDDLKIDATHPGGKSVHTHSGRNCAV